MKNSNSRIGNLARKAMFALVAGALSTVSAQTDHAALTGTRNSTDGLKITSGFKLTSSSYTVEVWVRPAALGDTLPMMDQFKGGTSGDWRFCVYPNVSG